MISHPLLRAYMAGVLAPTWFLPVVLEPGVYTTRQGVAMLPRATAIHYLVWKHALAFLNRVVEVR